MKDTSIWIIKKIKINKKQVIKQGRYKSHSEHTKIMNQTNYNVCLSRVNMKINTKHTQKSDNSGLRKMITQANTLKLGVPSLKSDKSSL